MIDQNKGRLRKQHLLSERREDEDGRKAVARDEGA